MIKVLFFIETLDGGGAEKVLRNLVNNMDQARFEITVQTAWPCDASKYLKTGIRYRSMYSSASRANRLRYRWEAETGLAYRLHIRDDYDIECAYLEMGATKIMSASTNKKAKKLAWVHCDFRKLLTDPEGFAKKTAKYYAGFDKVVCVSQAGKESFDALFGDKAESVVVHNTVDCEEIRCLALDAWPEGEALARPLVVSVGRLSEPKRYIRLLRAHNTLLEEGYSHSLVIVGEGPDRAELEAYIDEHHLQNSVYLIGFQSNPYPCMNAADLLACSSIYECFSTFITEGLVLGKPIVTTDVSGMRELLGDSEYGLITDNDDVGFCNGLRKMLADQELLAYYTERSRERGKRFSTQELVRKTEQFLLEMNKGK